jgi:hypothetical protein
MNEINFDVSNLKLNMFTNTEEIELYDLTCEYSSILLFKINTHTHTHTHTPIHDLFQQVDECIPYKEFSTNMKKINDEQ